MIEWICVFFLLVVVSGGIALAIRDRKRRRGEGIAGRPSLSLHELWTAYYERDGIAESNFSEVWHELARVAEYDPSRLRPDDTWTALIAHLSKREQTDDECCALVYPLISKCKKAMMFAEMKELGTVDGCVRAMLKLRERDRSLHRSQTREPEESG